MDPHTPAVDRFRNEHASPPPPAGRARSLGRLVAVIGPPLLVLAVGVLAFLALRQVSLTRERVNRSHHVVEVADQVMVDLLDAETGQRGYLITGDERYLQPYESARRRIPAALTELRTALADDPPQRARLDSLSVLARAKLDELQTTIDLRRADRLSAARGVVLTDRGRLLMNAARGTVADITAAAERRLDAGAAVERRSGEQNEALIVLGTGIAVLLALFINLVVARESAAREAALAEREAAMRERQALLERERDARREAEEANAAKSQFLATMSHELRTPLNAIGGYTELLSLGVRGPVTEQQREDLRRITRASQHLLALINDILNYARLEAGQVQVQAQEIDVDDVLDEMEALVGPQLRARELSYTCEQRDGDVRALADREKVQQILLNLLTNAIKFTEPGGRITVTSGRRDGHVHITVTDTGRGVPPDRLASIFEPFVQVDRHRTPESQQGVGLGLAISRDLARAMGGDITVASTPGAGSTFEVRLPAAAGSPDASD